MNISFLISPIRTLSIALLCVGALSNTASAAVVATYWRSEQTTATPLPAHDYLDGISASNLDKHGAVISGGQGQYTGWTDGVENPGASNYVSFILEAEEGFQMTLTSINAYTAAVRRGAGPGAVTDPITAYRWGFRVDDGAGYGDWVFNPKTYTPADGVPFRNGSVDKGWDFEDFTTSGKVEFGLFASASASTAALTFSDQNLNVNGDVSAVPEPSTYALIIVAGLALMVFARRRKLGRTV